MLHLGSNTKSEADRVASVDGQCLGVAGFGGTLVTDDICRIGVGVVTNVGSWVGGEFDWVVCHSSGGFADILELTLGDTADNVVVEEVVCGGHLGNSTEKNCDLHFDGGKFKKE